MSKRKRDPTFAASEKMALIDLVEKHFAIVECKKTDTVTMKKKTEEWKKIAIEFNSISSIHPRDWIVLKNCWENLKKRAKSENTLRNQHFLGTGGGPPKKIAEDPATERVLNLIQARVTGYVNCYDSDGTHILASSSTVPSQDTHNLPQEPNILCTDATNIGELEVHGAIETETSAAIFTVDWSQYTPSMLREARNPALATSPSQSPHQSPPNLPHVAVDMDQELCTPARTNTATVPTTSASGTTSRRRPILRHDRSTQSLAQERIKTLMNVNKQAEEEHDVQLRILKLQEEREKEILKQEQLKTAQEKIKLEMLEIQLRKLKE